MLLPELESANPGSTASVSAFGLGLERNFTKPTPLDDPRNCSLNTEVIRTGGWPNLQAQSTEERNAEFRMMHTIARNVTSARLLICLLATAFAASVAQGQARERIEIPYPFTLGSQQLPAGTYTVSLNGGLLVMQSSTGEPLRSVIITRLSGPNSFLQAGSLVFDSTGGRNRLSEVWLPREDGALVYGIPKGHTRTVLSFSELDSSGHASGKTAYELTCARCHGEEGKGNGKADQYFGVTIPRLSSADVQSKSDAELRAIITAGTKNMPPVEVEESGFRHRLPPQDVDEVIAYLRTLKQ